MEASKHLETHVYSNKGIILKLCFTVLILANFMALKEFSFNTIHIFACLGSLILFALSEFIDKNNNWFKYILVVFLVIFAGLFYYSNRFDFYDFPVFAIFFLGFLLFTLSRFINSDNKSFKYILFLFLIGSTITLTLFGSFNADLDHGNDNDEAMEVWINAFLSGNFPYELPTQLGNLITPFPFLPLYSMLFYFLGDVAFQNILNIFILLYILNKLSSNNDQLKFGLFSLCMALPLFFSLLIQSDHITVVSLLTLGIYFLYKSKFSIGSVLLGFLIASKGYVWLIIPSVIYYLKYRNGTPNTFKYMLIMLLICSIFIIPFILWNPHVFLTIAPFGAEKYVFANSIFPYPQFSLAILTILISLLTFYRTKDLFTTFFLTYLFFGIFSFSYVLFSKVILAIYVSAIMLGIIMYNGNKNIQ